MVGMDREAVGVYTKHKPCLELEKSPSCLGSVAENPTN